MAADHVVSIADEECDPHRKKWGKHCIYKLPASITDLNKKAYRPKTVSFGPYHHGSPKLRPMECHKSRVLDAFLERAGKSMDDCIKELSGVAQELMDAYDTLDRKWKNPAKFLETMITDGCFMLETMEYHYAYIVNGADHEVFKTRYDEKKDPIFSAHGNVNVMPFIRCDMLLLENQLPLLLLTKLLSLGGHVKLKESAKKEKKASSSCMDLCATARPSPSLEKEEPLLIQDLNDDHDYVVTLVASFCGPFTKPVVEYKKLKSCKRALDVHRQLLISGTKAKAPNWWSKWCKGYYSLFTPEYPNPKKHSWWSKWFKELPEDWQDEVDEYRSNIIPSASRFRESGISIRKSNTKSITNIHFWAGPVGGVLEVPHLVVDDDTEPVFRNLMAFERLHPGVGHHFTSYVTFMDDIIDSVQDVKILHNHDILSNALGSDTAVADLFNTLSEDATVDLDNKLVFERYIARKHCKRVWNRHWADLIHTYFNNPWTAIAVIAGLLAFGLGITDTIFNIRNHARKGSAAPPPPPPLS